MSRRTKPAPDPRAPDARGAPAYADGRRFCVRCGRPILRLCGEPPRPGCVACIAAGLVDAPAQLDEIGTGIGQRQDG